MDSTLNEAQKYSLELLKVFHDVCENNNLKYYMIGGTLLGAIRHGGFIPWDDDIDVAMPRKDYEFLLENQNRLFDERYGVVHYTNSDTIEMYINFSDLRYDAFIERNNSVIKMKFKIDVFPIDGTPDNGLLRKIHFFRLLAFRALFKFTLSDILEVEGVNSRSGFERFLIGFAKVTKIGRLINSKKTLTRLEKLLKKYDYEKSKKMAGTFLGAYKLREFTDVKYFTLRKMYKFEDCEFWGTEFADGYLTCIYGDYMQLPPEEKRFGKHRIVKIEESE